LKARAIELPRICFFLENVGSRFLSLRQHMQKGRRTEIEFPNGFVVREGEKVDLSCSANAVLTDSVKRAERNELTPDPRHSLSYG
jgi:ketopantoate reductase